MRRLPENPLITPADVRPSRPDFEVIGTFNAGVARLGDEVVLLLRVAERPRACAAEAAASSPRRRERAPGAVVAPIWNAERGELEVLSVHRGDPDLVEEDERVFTYRGVFHTTSISHLRVARSRDGVRFRVEEAPALFPELPTEAFGVEDPRITRIGGEFWVAYKAVSGQGIATALAVTRDFASFERKGVILCPENLDVAIFPAKVGEGYAALTRPETRHPTPPSIWLARSPDLLHWGRHERIMAPRPGKWDSGRIGASCVPFRTPAGWLEIYHGADERNRYCLGASLLDLEDPSKVLARSDEPLLWPEAPYEREGFFGDVVFSCGADVAEDGAVTVYYGASDEATCAARTTVEELLAHLGQ
jgi:predicted GH43/DUF377 family glycosyl hydrolase